MFVADIMKRLPHELPKPLSEPSWIQVEELLVDATHCELVIYHSWSLANIRGLTVESAVLRLDQAGLHLIQLPAFLLTQSSTAETPARY